jgi:hypothetical protein
VTYGFGIAGVQAETEQLILRVREDVFYGIPVPDGRPPAWLDWPEGFRVLRESVRWAERRRGQLIQDIAIEGPVLSHMADIASFLLAKKSKHRLWFQNISGTELRQQLAAAGLLVDVYLTDRVGLELERLHWLAPHNDVVYRLAILFFCFHCILDVPALRELLIAPNFGCVRLTYELVRLPHLDTVPTVFIELPSGVQILKIM